MKDVTKPVGEWNRMRVMADGSHVVIWINGERLVDANGQSHPEILKRSPAGAIGLWFGQVDKESTTIWAQFKGVNPNEQVVEINVRRTVFYPDKPGLNYLTVRGFILRHAATPWAPPTAEQVGLIRAWIDQGANWPDDGKVKELHWSLK